MDAFKKTLSGLKRYADKMRGASIVLWSSTSLVGAPGTPAESFGDDPLRMLRAARFAAQLRFTLAPDVRDAMQRMAGDLQRITAERIRDEFVKLLSASDPITGLRLLVDTGLAEYFLPELPGLRLAIDEIAQRVEAHDRQPAMPVGDEALGGHRRRRGRGDRAGNQYRRNNSPIGVPGPTRVSSSLSCLLSIAFLRARRCRRKVVYTVSS